MMPNEWMPESRIGKGGRGGQNYFLAGKHGAGGGSRTPTRVTPRQILSLNQIHSIRDEKLSFIN